MSEIGAGSGTSYPSGLDTNTTVEVDSPAANKTIASAKVVNDLASAVIAIETELGTDPAGSLTNVKTYLQTQHSATGTHTAVTATSLTLTTPLAVASGGTGNAAYSGKNAVHNGAMAIAQRGTSFTSATTYPNNDDAYTLDRWYILSDGNDVVDVTQETSTVPTNGLYAMALDVETANKKFGIAQIIEQKNCIGLIGNTVTLSFKAKVSSTTNLDNVKAAIISWSGTADVVTSDIISAWNVEGTNPTLIANATYENTPANLSLTTLNATYSVSAAVDTASTKNIILFVWSDVTTTTVGGADILYITDVQLENGSVATDFEREAQGVTLAKCQRYFETIVGGATGAPFGSGYATTTAILWAYVKYLPKRSIPSVTHSTASNFRISYQATSTVVTSIAYTAPSLSAVRANVTGTGTPLTVGEGGLFADNNSGAGIIYIDSEM